MSYNLFLDDERFPPNDGRNWVILRSSVAAIQYFKDHGPPDFISFDHDLGGEDKSIIYIDWLIELCLDMLDLGINSDDVAFPRNYTVHSQNPIGAANIEGKMNNFIHHLNTVK